MIEPQHPKLRKGLSLTGKILSRLHRFCYNIKNFVSLHNFSIQILFLITYFLLQLILAIVLVTFEKYLQYVVPIFIVIFLFLIAFERIILQLKSDDIKNARDTILSKYLDLKARYTDLVKDYKELREDNKELISIIKQLIKKGR